MHTKNNTYIIFGMHFSKQITVPEIMSAGQSDKCYTSPDRSPDRMCCKHHVDNKNCIIDFVIVFAI